MATVVIIDGSNVAQCSAWRERSGVTSHHELRRSLVDAVAGWIATAEDADQVQLVFDGAGPWAPGETRITPVVTVVGSGARSGDEVVMRLAKAHTRRRDSCWIVSSDREVRAVAGASAVREFDADAFVQLLAARPDPPSGPADPPPLRRGIAHLIDDAMRSKLERLRRNE